MAASAAAGGSDDEDAHPGNGSSVLVASGPSGATRVGIAQADRRFSTPASLEAR